MSNPFSSYRLIPAEGIIRSNIRRNEIPEDLKSLITALTPLKYLSKSKLTEGSSLNSAIVRNLTEKTDTLSLLDYFGYRRNNQNEYVYQSSTSAHETEKRGKGVDEFVKFYDYLKSLKSDSLYELERFIQNVDRPSSADSNRQSNNEPATIRLNPRPNFIPPPPPPSEREIEKENEKTVELIESLKISLVTKYDAPPSQSFIRRKLAILLCKQKNPDSIEVGDNFIDQAIDQKILSMKQHDTQTNVPRTDAVYVECLLRSNLDEKKALEILRHKRPNLVPPPVAKPVSTNPIKVSLANSVEYLKQHWRLLSQHNNEDNSTVQSLPENDKWKNVKHLVPAIQQLQQKNTNQSADEELLSKMYRLLYSELLHTVGPQLPVKIETLAAILCESSSEYIENLDAAIFKNILCSSADFNDGFGSGAMNSLSIQCPICNIYYPRTQMETMLLCRHECCTECIKNYYRNTINEIGNSQSLNKLPCFMEKIQITEDNRMNFFICLESKLRQWFHDEPDIVKKYVDNIRDATFGEKIRRCGSSKCVGRFSTDDNGDPSCVLCPYCDFAQCSQCRLKWCPEHTEMECEEYEEWLIHNNPDDPEVQALKCISATAIVCPNEDCRAIYDYEPGGCEHFTCEECQTAFCRMCSALFYLPSKDLKCPQDNCILKKTIHAHCCPNCFRETRIGQEDAIIELLIDHDINLTEELQKTSVSTNNICSVKGCTKPASTVSEGRLCEMCYKQFLCSLIWRHGLEPWAIYEDNNLQQMLKKASVTIPENVTREDLIDLCKQNLNQSLGKPKKLKKPKA